MLLTLPLLLLPLLIQSDSSGAVKKRDSGAVVLQICRRPICLLVLSEAIKDLFYLTPSASSPLRGSTTATRRIGLAGRLFKYIGIEALSCRGVSWTQVIATATYRSNPKDYNPGGSPILAFEKPLFYSSFSSSIFFCKYQGVGAVRAFFSLLGYLSFANFTRICFYFNHQPRLTTAVGHVTMTGRTTSTGTSFHFPSVPKSGFISHRTSTPPSTCSQLFFLHCCSICSCSLVIPDKSCRCLRFYFVSPNPSLRSTMMPLSTASTSFRSRCCQRD